MSQPLSGAQGKRVPIQSERKKYVVTRFGNQESGERTINVRTLVTLLLLLAGIVCVPVGSGLLWGSGGAVIAVGAVALILGVILGLL